MKKFLILAIVLIVPAVAYLVLQTGKNQYSSLEIFGPKEPVLKTAAGKQVCDTVYHTVSGFNFLDQDSLPVTESVQKGRISVVDFFFSTCTTICPKMSNQMMRVQHKFSDEKDVVLLSFTVDPQNDTPSRLKEYANKHKAVKGKWYFLTGKKEEIYKLAAESYFLVAAEGQGGGEAFLHSENVLLIDKEGRIRGIYDGTDHFEVKRLMEDMDALKFGYENGLN